MRTGLPLHLAQKGEARLRITPHRMLGRQALMTSRVIHLLRSHRNELWLTADTHPTDRFWPVRICDDSLEEIHIYRNDQVVVNLAQHPRPGELSVFEMIQGILLGFPFSQPNGLIRIESVCQCWGCRPAYIDPFHVSTAGPITKILRQRGNASFIFAYRRIRGALWER